jgi:GNAT superfamily N-acetyltransferase
VLRLQGTIGTIEELVVREGRRGQGVGDRLVQYAKGLAAERGWVRLGAAVARARDAHRRGFFVAHGFGPVDSVAYRWSLLEGSHPVLPVLRSTRRRRELV